MTKPKIAKRQRPRRTIDGRRTKFPTKAAAALVLLATASTRLASPQHRSRSFLFASAAECNPCEGLSNGFVQIPETECSEFAQCNDGNIAQRFNCQAGLIYDVNLSQCNWAASAVCGPDPECPTPEPTPRPSYEPTMYPSPDPTPETDDGVDSSDNDNDDGGSSFDSRPSLGGTSPNPPTPPLAAPGPTAPVGDPLPVPPAAAVPAQAVVPDAVPLTGLEPIRFEHHSAVWAHLNANKIAISNQLLRMSHRLQNVQGSNVNADELRNYAYYDFHRALQSMAEEGYAVPMGADQVDANGNPLLARRVFYMGDVRYDGAAAVGLVNAATFLSQALADSISSGSCDEINQDVVDGFLPISNSCGQYGQSYQGTKCSKEEEFMECTPYGSMEMYANPSGRPVTPFYCGPKDKYPFTGSANYVSGRAQVTEPVPNQNDRTDVEGCCWWGRGTISTRGICQYGKLNYYLGARAAQEGRPARYAQIDFCATPSSICSTAQKQDSEIEWISGLFRWIDDVQSYDDGQGWNYVQQLHDFVAGGMVDGQFILSVSAIVTQGCHQAPCPGVTGTGGEMTDAGDRQSYFVQVLDALGLPTSALRQS